MSEISDNAQYTGQDVAMRVKKNISAVERAMKILELFLNGSESLSVPDFVSLLNLPRSTTHELVRTLVNLGYLFPDRNNRIGWRLCIESGFCERRSRYC